MNRIEKSQATIFDSTNFFSKFIVFLLIVPILSLVSPLKYLLVFLLFFCVLILLSRKGLKLLKEAKIYLLMVGIITIVIIPIFSPGTFLERITFSSVLALRIMSVITAGLFFSIIVDPKEIPIALINLRVPHKYGIVLMIAYRMIPITRKKIQNIIIAQRCRGLSNRIWPFNFSRIANLLGSIFVPIIYSSLETSVRFSDTLLSRGYNPDGTITFKRLKFTIWDFCLIFLILGLFIVSLIDPF